LISTIKSIENQTFKAYEVWVVDGKSSEETQEFLHKLEPPFFYQSAKDKGIYDAMNKGIFLSNGEWLYFLGAEDVFDNNDVLQAVFGDANFDNSSIISGKITYQGILNPLVIAKNKWIQNPSWSKFMWIRNGLHHQGTFYKKALFFEVKYNLEYSILSDYWFNLYLFKRKESCVLIDKKIAICTSNGVSKLGNWALYQQEINLKTALTSYLLKPFFYAIAFLKFLSRKIAND